MSQWNDSVGSRAQWYTPISISRLEAEIEGSNFKACLCYTVSQDSLGDQMTLDLQIKLNKQG